MEVAPVGATGERARAHQYLAAALGHPVILGTQDPLAELLLATAAQVVGVQAAMDVEGVPTGCVNVGHDPVRPVEEQRLIDLLTAADTREPIPRMHDRSHGVDRAMQAAHHTVHKVAQQVLGLPRASKQARPR